MEFGIIWTVVYLIANGLILVFGPLMIGQERKPRFYTVGWYISVAIEIIGTSIALIWAYLV